MNPAATQSFPSLLKLSLQMSSLQLDDRDECHASPMGGLAVAWEGSARIRHVVRLKGSLLQWGDAKKVGVPSMNPAYTI